MIICSICENGPVAGRLPAKYKLKHFRMRRKQRQCRFNCPSGVPGAKMAAFPSSWPPVAAGRPGTGASRVHRPALAAPPPPPPAPLGAPWATLQPPQGSGSETGHAQLGQCHGLHGPWRGRRRSQPSPAGVLELLTPRGSPTRGPWALRPAPRVPAPGAAPPRGPKWKGSLENGPGERLPSQ